MLLELAAELAISNLKLNALPKGYRLVATLFQWENECQTEGWNAFEWTPDIAEIVQAFYEVGLTQESEAISRAAAAWALSGEDYDAADEAYHEQSNGYKIDLDRFEYLVDYFCEHADEIFYEPA